MIVKIAFENDICEKRIRQSNLLMETDGKQLLLNPENTVYMRRFYVLPKFYKGFPVNSS